jgi:hypothetical protein
MVVAVVGTGLTTALVVGVAVTDILNLEFTGLIGIPAGVAAGLGALTAVVAFYDRLGRWSRVAVDGVAGFSYGLLLGYSVVVLLTDPTPGLPVRRWVTLAGAAGVIVAAAVSVFSIE